MRFYIFFLIPFMVGCASGAGLNLGQYPDKDASPDQFIVCHGYGCSSRSYSSLSAQEWRSVRDTFAKKAVSAQAEREQIAQAIAKIESYVGVSLNLQGDQARAPILKTSDQELDCIDETVNTTKYLTFLAEENLLRFHEVGRPAYKGFLIDGTYPHNSATVVEMKTKIAYVVDSYIYANGQEPVIRPLKEWQVSSTLVSD